MLHDDILAHQQPVAQSIHGAKQLLDECASRLRPEDCSKLEDISKELKDRYDNVYVESQTRQNKIQGVVPDLEKFTFERDDTDRWIKDGTKTLSDAKRNIATDLVTLKGQLQKQSDFNESMVAEGADVRYLNMSGQRITDVAKV